MNARSARLEPFSEPSSRQRIRIEISGAVQGVGFRPTVYRLARELGLGGWVRNTASGVLLEAEGPSVALDEFETRLIQDAPPHSLIRSVETTRTNPTGCESFTILASSDGERTALIQPDIATCPDCLKEVLDPNNRRYRYPFTNCTHCGPRFSILEHLPYDRPNTSMAGFAMCEECRREYEDPGDRRFHAQPNACHHCGPQLSLWNQHGEDLAERNEALVQSAAAIREGRIVAVKGLGGFHLLVDAMNGEAIQRLRDRKHREEKPLAVMVSSLEIAEELCRVSPLEEQLLQSSEGPIVLLRRQKARKNRKAAVHPSAAPGNPNLGLMLPYTPLHHLLLHEAGCPVVATSGNLSDEPICTDESEAVKRLAGIADFFLIHNRSIVRPVDDSIVRVVAEREMILRRSRGYAPLPVSLKSLARPCLATGALLKNVSAAAAGNQVFLSQHVGDLETCESYTAFQRALDTFGEMRDFKPEFVVCDLHPDYLSTRHAESCGLPVRKVQHHAAHVFSCMAENEIEPPLLGVAWDGTGYGLDKTIWGCEFFRVDGSSVERVAHLRPFRLPGGDGAVREPWRSALGILHEMDEDADFQATIEGLPAVKKMLEAGINSPVTTSMGRFFDAAAALLGTRLWSRFEGQAAMELEFLADGVESGDAYPFSLDAPSNRPLQIDWAPMIGSLLRDRDEGLTRNLISARFHNSLCEMIVAIARRIGEGQVVLSGGCFQNKVLIERTIKRLREEGFQPFWHRLVPPNDGGIALGQVVGAMRSDG